MSQTKKRFIAGAVCPRCKAMDTIQVYRENDRDFRSCVACDFEEGANFQHVGKELPTRVNVTHRQDDHRAREDVAVVKIVTPVKTADSANANSARKANEQNKKD